MIDYENHGDVVKALTRSQENDRDNREAAKEAHVFVDKRDGQWEQSWWNASDGRPRYTFDQVGPIVDTIAGDMERSEFGINISEAGDGASEESAKIISGMMRTIQNLSNAVSDVFNPAARNMVISGIDGWCLKQKYVDDNSFFQDIVIEHIPDFVDSVWFGPFFKPDASDAPYVFVLEQMTKDDYEEQYPDGAAISVSEGTNQHAYASCMSSSGDDVIVGNIYYYESKKKTLLLMSSGRVLNKEDSQEILDELAEMGDSVVMEREREDKVVMSRLFDGSGWLNEPEETVWNALPVIPVMVNFKIIERRLIYRGAVEKLMDPCRVYNYGKSREIEEGALAPRAKYWMTKKQAEGYESTLRTLNTNSDPVQFFNPDQMLPGPPVQSGGAVVNPGLVTMTTDMRDIIQRSSGIFSANMGDNPGLQSGVALERLQDKGDIGTTKYFKAQERAISRTAKIITDAIPLVYSDERQVRIMNEDYTSEVVMLNQPIYDRQSGKMVTVNDVTTGTYGVICLSGPSFKSKQGETVAAMTEIASVDPTILTVGSDILLRNITTPGMDVLADRLRWQLFQNGQIPEDQMTDEEKQLVEAQRNQPPPPDPAMVLAQAEVGKAQAQTQKVLVDASVAERRENRADVEAQVKMQKDDRDFNYQQMKDMQAMMMQQQKETAALLKAIREGIGVETIISPEATQAFENAAVATNFLTGQQ